MRALPSLLFGELAKFQTPALDQFTLGRVSAFARSLQKRVVRPASLGAPANARQGQRAQKSKICHPNPCLCLQPCRVSGLSDSSWPRCRGSIPGGGR